jgi:hypothetical protein
MSTYNKDNSIKNDLVNNIYSSIIHNTNPINKQISFNAIQIETENLLKREQTLFTINIIISVCLIFTIFKTL